MELEQIGDSAASAVAFGRDFVILAHGRRGQLPVSVGTYGKRQISERAETHIRLRAGDRSMGMHRQGQRRPPVPEILQPISWLAAQNTTTLLLISRPRVDPTRCNFRNDCRNMDAPVVKIEALERLAAYLVAPGDGGDLLVHLRLSADSNHKSLFVLGAEHYLGPTAQVIKDLYSDFLYWGARYDEDDALKSALDYRAKDAKASRRMRQKLPYELGLVRSRTRLSMLPRPMLLPELRNPYPPKRHHILENRSISRKWEKYIKTCYQADRRLSRLPCHMVDEEMIVYNLSEASSGVFRDAKTGMI